MSGKFTHTPLGVSDLLFEEYELWEKIIDTAREVYGHWGYRGVKTPSFEYSDMYTLADPINQENMYKFFDEKGHMLSLRPDITTSVARIAATKLSENNLPLKISYCGSVFRNEEAFGQTRKREFTQTGIELIGEKSARADAEVIEIAIEVLKSAGLSDFQIDIGQIEFFKGLAQSAGLDDKNTDTLREIIDSKDFIGIGSILDKYDISDELKDLFFALPTLFGGIEIVKGLAGNKTLNARSKDALLNLMSVYEILKEKGFEKYISIDLGMVPSLDYYTGIIIKGVTKAVGFPLCNGGRYDSLTEKFGKALPSTGVAFGVERIAAAINAKREEETYVAESDYITVALAKGRLSELSSEIFEKIGFDCSELYGKSRKLVFRDDKNKVKFVLVKASDVPTYVEYGAADMGIVGKDTLMESDKNLYEVLDLGFGECKMAVAGPKEMRGQLGGKSIMRVASKYPRIAQDYFHRVKGQTVDIIKLNGSVELGPIVGLSEVIVDIVESGKTLHENGLEVLEDICRLSARLVVNRVSMKVKRERIVDIIDKMRKEIKK